MQNCAIITTIVAVHRRCVTTFVVRPFNHMGVEYQGYGQGYYAHKGG